MGNGAAKKNKNQQAQPVVPKQPTPRPSLTPSRLRSPLSPPVIERLDSARVQGTAGQSRASVRSVAKDDTLLNQSNDNHLGDEGDIHSPSHSLFGRAGGAVTPSEKRSSTGLGSPTVSHHHHHLAPLGSGTNGRFCTHCPHCKRRNDGDYSTSSTPTPAWLGKRPLNDHVCINMDEYDTLSKKEKVPKKLDHAPQTTIIVAPRTDYDTTKENYFTLPFIAKTTPRVTPTSTPFPGYSALQRKERRPNKPYTSTLFVD